MVTTRSQAAARTAPALRSRAKQMRRRIQLETYNTLRLRNMVSDMPRPPPLSVAPNALLGRKKAITPEPPYIRKGFFPFLSLPAEVRTCIYQYVLQELGPIFLDTCPVPRLACVSRQLRQEAIPAFLKINAFRTLSCRREDETHETWFASQTLSWLRSVSLTLPLIRNITFDIQSEKDQLHPEGAFQVLANGGRPRLLHTRIYCPLCPKDHFPNLYHRAIKPFMRHRMLETKRLHHALLEECAEFFWPDHTAAGLSFTDIVDASNGLADLCGDDTGTGMEHLTKFLRYCYEAIEKVIDDYEYRKMFTSMDDWETTDDQGESGGDDLP